MVNGFARSKNLSKMKLPKPKTKSRRNRFRVFKEDCAKAPKETLDKLPKIEKQVKSGCWKCKPTSASSSSASELKPTISQVLTSKFKPGTLYSDVLFREAKPLTDAKKIKTVAPRLVGSYPKISKTLSRRRKRTQERKDPDTSKESNVSRKISKIKLVHTISSKKLGTAGVGLGSESDLQEFTSNLMKRLNIKIHSWNFTDFGTINDVPKFCCHFDDYNYLVCEGVAFAALKLASDGKFFY